MTTMRNFCHTFEFRNIVREVLNEDAAIKDLITRLNLSAQIDACMVLRLPILAKTEIANHLPRLFDHHMREYLTYTFPSVVAERVKTFLTTYVAENADFRLILENNNQKLEARLSARAKEILEKICADKEYTEIMAEHGRQLDLKGEAELNRQRALFASTLRNMQTDYETSRQALRDDLQSIKNLRSQVEQQQRDLQLLASGLNCHSIILAMGLVSSISCGILYFMRG